MLLGCGMTPSAVTHVLQATSWTERLPPEQNELYTQVMKEAMRRGLRFAIGGGFASNLYTGVWRNTKDLDIFVLESDREFFVALLTDLGLVDYYDQKPYDRSWIYRACRGDLIIDVIWQMANHRAPVDEVWLNSGPCVELDGGHFPVVPPEETLWTKLYVMQRERCDWPDALNVISALGPELNWARLIDRVGEDAALLKAALSVFAWICPRRAMELPAWIWGRLQAEPPANGDPRPHLLDSRPWLVNPC
jgi:hypothetical protein